MNENVHDEHNRATRSCESKNKNRSKFNPCGKKCSSSVAYSSVMLLFFVSFFFDMHLKHEEEKISGEQQKQNSTFITN